MKAMRIQKRGVLLAALIGVSLALPVPMAFAGPPVKVNEAIPNMGEQGTLTLDVTIKGRGFENASPEARFFRTGTSDTGGVRVNSTSFVDSKTLIANITINELADIDLYDIEVEMLATGRKGKGTERFSVLAQGGGGNDEIHLCAVFRDLSSDLIRSDGLSYCNGTEHLLTVRIGKLNGHFNLYANDTSREVFLDFPSIPDDPQSRSCVEFTDAACSTEGNFNTLNEWEYQGGYLTPTFQKLDLSAMGEGTGYPATAYVDFQFGFPSVSKSTPNLIIFGGSNHDMCGDPALVTRLDDDTWTIEASWQTACLVEIIKKGNRRMVHLPFSEFPFKMTMTRQP